VNIYLAIALFLVCWWVVFLVSLPRKLASQGDVDAVRRTSLVGNVVIATVAAIVFVTAFWQAVSLGIIDPSRFLVQ
jgi:hypothetical protein